MHGEETGGWKGVEGRLRAKTNQEKHIYRCALLVCRVCLGDGGGVERTPGTRARVGWSVINRISNIEKKEVGGGGGGSQILLSYMHAHRVCVRVRRCIYRATPPYRLLPSGSTRSSFRSFTAMPSSCGLGWAVVAACLTRRADKRNTYLARHLRIGLRALVRHVVVAHILPGVLDLFGEGGGG